MTLRHSRGALCANTAAVAVIVLGMPSANAAVFAYGDFSGNTVDYLAVTEDATGSATPLFGAPSVVGDTLDFDPQNFNSEAANGTADTTVSALNFTISAHDGFGIPMFTISESGDFTLNGLAGEASATVAAPIFIEVTEIDGVPLGAPYEFNGLMTFTSGGDFFLTEEGIGTGIFEGTATFNIDALLAGEGETGSATKVEVALENSLSTASVAGTAAFIAKKDFDGVAVTVIPEPASLLLVGAGAGLMASRRRR